MRRVLILGLLIFVSVASAQTYPIKASANGRYLVDQNGEPFMLMADAAWGLMQNLTPTQMATYMSTRQAQGFNAIMVPITYAVNGTPSSSGAAQDGTQPFTTGTTYATYNLATPNSAYFAEVDAMINLAKTYNLVVMLNPMDNYTFLVQSGSGGTLQNNGTTATYNYGAYLGNRYSSFTNVMWYPGNDFQDWNTSSSDNNLALQLMEGIKSADANHLMTIELNYNFSYSNQDTTLAPVLTLDMAYTYGGIYDEILQGYNSSPTLPVFMGESNYEGENNTGGLPAACGVYCIRLENYWTMTSGGTGVNYGNHDVWMFDSSWTTSINSAAAGEIQYFTKFFNGIPWWNLVPDQSHVVVTAGYGTYNASGLDQETNNYCPTSWVTDGSLSITYCPGNTSPTGALTLTVNMAKFNGPVTAKWYDPSNGTYSTIAGSPFSNSGTQNFSPSSLNNHDGNPDWVLLLQTSGSSANPPAPPTGLSATVNVN